MSGDEEIELEHHRQGEVCETRPPYRQGRKLTAIKTYTINNESVYVLIFGVPKINLRNELKTQCKKYGALASLTVTAGYKTEQFTECFLAKYDRIQSARTAKRKLDTRNFFGGLLHVCYAPELESVEETRHKLDQRRFEVNRQLIKVELSKNSVVDILKNETNLSENSLVIDNMSKISSFDSLRQDFNNSNSSSSISLHYSSNRPNNPLKSVTDLGPLQIEFLPDCLPTVNISNNQHNSSTVNFWSNSNTKVDSNGFYIGTNERFKSVPEPLSNFSESSQKIAIEKKEYVFKRKHKKKSKKVKVLGKVGSDFLNSVEILKDTNEKDSLVVGGVEDFGKVTVCDVETAPKVVKLPQKPLNKIVFNIKHDKLL